MEQFKKSVEIENPKGLYDPRPHGYSHMVTIPSNSTLIFVSGQGGSDGDNELSDDFRTQVVNAYKNLSIALGSKGLNLHHIVKVTMLVVDYDADKHQILTEEAKKIWPDEKYPTNTLIPVALLALEGMQIEIEATAVVVGDAGSH